VKDYLTIKEFSKFSGIEQTTLRYWDDIGLFSPMCRNPENNYRYYTPEQLISVNFITVLSNLGIPLKTIGEIERQRTPQSVVELIEHQERLVDMEMRKLREQYSIIHTRRELIKYGMNADTSKIAVLPKDERSFILGPRNDWKTGEPFYEYFMKFCDMADELRVNLSFPIGGYHEDFDSFLRAPGEPDFFFSIDPTGNRKRDAGNYLCGYERGYYGQLGDLPERLATHAKEQGLTLHGPVYTVYLEDEICTSEPDQYLAQITVAVM